MTVILYQNTFLSEDNKRDTDVQQASYDGIFRRDPAVSLIFTHHEKHFWIWYNYKVNGICSHSSESTRWTDILRRLVSLMAQSLHLVVRI